MDRYSGFWLTCHPVVVFEQSYLVFMILGTFAAVQFVWGTFAVWGGMAYRRTRCGYLWVQWNSSVLPQWTIRVVRKPCTLSGMGSGRVCNVVIASSGRHVSHTCF